VRGCGYTLLRVSFLGKALDTANNRFKYALESTDLLHCAIMPIVNTFTALNKVFLSVWFFTSHVDNYVMSSYS